MGSQYLLITCVRFWLPLVSFTISVASQKSTTGPGNVIEGNVFINGTTSIGRIDDDFVCATLDWWPPEKCDYGTCSWGRDSLLNLVSWSSSKWFFFLPHYACCVINQIKIHLYQFLYWVFFFFNATILLAKYILLVS